MPNPAFFSWISRYKLHHILFWATYNYAWWVYLDATSTMMQTSNFIKFSSFVVIHALGVYFCLYYLIPNQLEKRKYFLYVLSVILVMIVMGFLITGGFMISDLVAGTEYHDPEHSRADVFWEMLKKHALPSCLGSMTLGMSIKLGKNYLQTKQREQELEKENLETELKFLKSQFNPHFLFNTINSIFVLINKSPDEASESLAKFSSLLRYQLYECNERQIPLNRELSYLEGFIELEKLRLEKNFDVDFRLPMHTAGAYTIAPFLLMPFIENAFKHVSHHKDQNNWITIHIDLRDDHMIFDIKNSTSTKSDTVRKDENYGGLGLQNIQRRLDLLYKDKHSLQIERMKTTFQVNLNIQLEKMNTDQLIPSSI